jgi:hypothetical protein
LEARFSSLFAALCMTFLIAGEIIVNYHMVWKYVGSLNKDLEMNEIGNTGYMQTRLLLCMV